MQTISLSHAYVNFNLYGALSHSASNALNAPTTADVEPISHSIAGARVKGDELPRYGLHWICLPVAQVAERQHLRSASRRLLVVPWIQLHTYGRRAFSVVGPIVWNALSSNLRDPELSIASFSRLGRPACTARTGSRLMCQIINSRHWKHAVWRDKHIRCYRRQAVPADIQMKKKIHA